MSSSSEFVDDGSRYGERFARKWEDDQEGDRSRVEERAAESGEGAWSEDLGVNVYGEELWTPPGMGESGPRCDEWQADSVCESCGKLGLTQHRCGRRECPECWGIWAKDSSMRVTRRIQEFRYTQADDWHSQVAHLSESVPEGEVTTLREFKEAWKDAYRLAQEKGMRGGVVIPHPWRVEEDAKAEYREEDPDVGMWVWVREEYGEEWREAVYWSPHFHIIGFTTPDMDPGDDEADEGWIHEFIRSLERCEGPRCKESTKDVYGAVRYLLSHTGFRTDEDMKSVRYFGCLAPTSFTEKDKPSKGVQSVIERTVEEVADGEFEDEEEEGSGEEEPDEESEECPEEDCDGLMISVFEIDAYLRQAEPPPDVAERMKVAREWRLGQLRPPPGLMHPESEEDAREAFEAML